MANNRKNTMTMDNILLKVKDLKAGIDGKEILKGINLEVRPGEFELEALAAGADNYKLVFHNYTVSVVSSLVPWKGSIVALVSELIPSLFSTAKAVWKMILISPKKVMLST